LTFFGEKEVSLDEFLSAEFEVGPFVHADEGFFAFLLFELFAF